MAVGTENWKGNFHQLAITKRIRQLGSICLHIEPLYFKYGSSVGCNYRTPFSNTPSIIRTLSSQDQEVTDVCGPEGYMYSTVHLNYCRAHSVQCNWHVMSNNIFSLRCIPHSTCIIVLSFLSYCTSVLCVYSGTFERRTQCFICTVYGRVGTVRVLDALYISYCMFALFRG